MLLMLSLAVIVGLLSIFSNTQHFIKNLIVLEMINLMLLFSLMNSYLSSSITFFLMLFLVLALSGAVLGLSIVIHMSGHWGTDQSITIS